jgi:hypothetical protein
VIGHVAAHTEKSTIIRILNSAYTVFEALAYIRDLLSGLGAQQKTRRPGDPV